MFGGIGAIRKALINIKIPYKIIDYVEIDKNCVKSYNALYNEQFIPKSVVGYNLPNKKIDIVMHGSPCQDFSRVGKGLGGLKGSGTRSSLLFETVRIIEEAKYRPKIIIWENVKAVLDKNNKETFLMYIDELKRLGYDTKYEVLNSFYFGIPQKRERVFAISYLGENKFDFSELERREAKHLSEFLEKDVSDLYTVKQKSMLRLLYEEDYKPKYKKRLRFLKDFCYTILTSQMTVPNSGFIELDNGKYRYLTERECLRLMGFSDKDVDVLESVHPRRKGCTSSILYKQAGNSIVVNVLKSILIEIVREV